MPHKVFYTNAIFVSILHFICTLYLKLARWKVVGTIPDVSKCVVIAAPHTSNWDFPTFLSLVGYFNLNVRYFGKHSLFEGPFGWFFYRLGGMPVHRETSKASDMIDVAVKSFANSDKMMLGIAPEGTRSSVIKWKTGFYRIAVAADVPIAIAYLDASKREVGFSHLFYPTGDMDKDMAEIQAFYAEKVGINPKNT